MATAKELSAGASENAMNPFCGEAETEEVDLTGVDKLDILGGRKKKRKKKKIIISMEALLYIFNISSTGNLPK